MKILQVCFYCLTLYFWLFLLKSSCKLHFRQYSAQTKRIIRYLPNAATDIKSEFLSVLSGIYLVKVNNRNTKTRYEIFSKLTKTPERCQYHRSGVFIDSELVSYLVLVFLLLDLNM